MLRPLTVAMIASLVCVAGCDRDVTTAPSDNGLAAMPGGLAAARLRAIDLGPSAAFAINDKGEVAGETETAPLGYPHATFWDHSGAMTDLGVFSGGTYSAGLGINIRGAVVGYADTAGTVSTRAFVWKPGWSSIFSLAMLPGGSWAMAHDINDYSVIVGAGDDASGTMNAVRWDPSGISTLGSLPGGHCPAWVPGACALSRAHAINNYSEIVGYSYDATGTVRPVRWTRFGGINDLGTLPGDVSGKAYAINDEGNGDIVGYSEGSRTHAVLWPQGGGIVDLGVLPGGSYSYATGINVSGEISGYADDATGQQQAVRWQRGSHAIVNLALPGHMGSTGYAINRKGTVAGNSLKGVISHAICWSLGPNC